MDDLIRRGQSSRILKTVAVLYDEGVPNEHRAMFANICRRVGRGDLSVKLLVQIVNAENSQATVEEKVAFAAGLIAVGAGLEGTRILSKLDPDEDPDILLYLAISHFTRWEYSESNPLLERFIAHPKISDYQKIIGRINLASALIFLRSHLEARSLLHGLLREIENEERYNLVTGNAYELLAQTAIGLRESQLADMYLQKAEKKLGADSGVTRLFLDKWKAVNKLNQPDKQKEGLTDLQKVSVEAFNRKHWETLRETQFFLALGTQDNSLFHKVYYGTPYAGYRQRILDIYPCGHPLPRDYTYQLANAGKVHPEVLDIKTASKSDGNSFLPRGGLLHKTFVALARDIYKPARVAEIFSQVYADEYYDPYSSPHRVYEAINRLRKHLAKHKIPVQIQVDNGTYTLSSREPIGLRLHLDQQFMEPSNLHLSHFLSKWPKRDFQAIDLAGYLGVSIRTAQRIINAELKKGTLVKVKEGRESTYRNAG